MIDATPFIAGDVTKWINATIAAKSFVRPVPRYCRVNFAVEDCVKIVPRRVDGT